VVQRPVPPSQARGRGDGAVNEVERVVHGPRERPAERQSGGDRGGEGAPGAVRRGGFDAGPGEAVRAARADQHVGDGVAFEVATLHEDDLSALTYQREPGVFHLLGSSDLLFRENPRLVDIGCDERGERDQTPRDRALRIDGEEPVAGRGDHHRIEYVIGEAVAGDAVGDGFHQLRRAQHARFDGLRREILRERVELPRHERRGDGLPEADAARVLRRHGAHDAGAEDPELVERLEVRLDAGSAPGVRAGDGEGDPHAPGPRRLAARVTAAKFPCLAGDPIVTNLPSTIRDLKRRKARGRRGLALVEGVRLVEEAVSAGVRIVGAVVAPELARSNRGAELRIGLERRAVPVQEVTAKVFGPLADTDSPQGIIAVVEPRRWTIDAIPLDGAPVVLVIDGVQDPGNVGTLLRTAHALGARATIVLRGTADVWGLKALRAAMGATFRHPVVGFDDAGFIAWARRSNVTLWATAADGEPLDRAIPAGEGGRGKGVIAVIVGNEGAGIRPHLNAVAAKRVAIPLAQGAESLNVAVAAGILLYEVTHGR